MFLKQPLCPTVVIHMPSKRFIYKARKQSEVNTRVGNNIVLTANRENPYVAELVKNSIDAPISYWKEYIMFVVL